MTWFKNRVKNLIDIVQVSDAVYHYENVNRADIEGVETELSALMGSRWNWRLSHVYLDAENKTDGTMLDNRARHTVTAALFYDDHDDYGWSGAIWDTFQDHYRFDDEAYTFQTLNTSIRKRWNDWSMTAGVYNWFDKKVDDLTSMEENGSQACRSDCKRGIIKRLLYRELRECDAFPAAFSLHERIS